MLSYGLIHVIMQALPSTLPWLGPVLPGAEVSVKDTSALVPVPICPDSSALVPKCLDTFLASDAGAAGVEISQWHFHREKISSKFATPLTVLVSTSNSTGC